MCEKVFANEAGLLSLYAQGLKFLIENIRGHFPDLQDDTEN